MMALFVFAGQTCCEEADGPAMRLLAGQVRSAALEVGVAIADVRVCFAPSHTERKWAVYSPTAAEVASFGGDWWAAERATRCVPALARDLTASASEAWAAMDAALSNSVFF